MSKASLLFPLFFVVTSFISCSGNNIEIQNTGADFSTTKQIDTTYVPTGFYFLAEGANTVKMKEENSNRIYSISKTPFASVDNIKQTKLHTTKLDSGNYTELCMAFDDKGTKDLEEGTGNNAHP
jgi:hypothetical protein